MGAAREAARGAAWDAARAAQNKQLESMILEAHQETAK